jgi:uncharacterized damage-inducible protein DinB
MNKQPEFWLRGPIESYPLILQPVVHAILQAQLEIHELMHDFPTELLWERPAGMASPAFHLQHISGVLDRMATYAKAAKLNESQFEYLKQEGKENTELTTEDLIQHLDSQITDFLHYISTLEPSTVTDYRGVGRGQLPSTVGGLLFHGAEHMQRHFGQLLVTVKVILNSKSIAVN